MEGLRKTTQNCPTRNSNQAPLEYNSCMFATVSSFSHVHKARCLIKHRHVTFHLSYRNDKEWVFKDGNVANQSAEQPRSGFLHRQTHKQRMRLFWILLVYGPRQERGGPRVTACPWNYLCEARVHWSLIHHRFSSWHIYFHFTEYLPVVSRKYCATVLKTLC
jgi:hypothetical protein